MAKSVPGSQDKEMRHSRAQDSLATSIGRARSLAGAGARPVDELGRVATQNAITHALAAKVREVLDAAGTASRR